MANVARLDSKMRRDFVYSYFLKHRAATLKDANDELKKKFTRGMASKGLSDLKARANEHLAELKKQTRPLGQEQNVPEHIQERRDEEKQLLDELKNTTKALAQAMKSPRCPVFRIVLTRGPDGKVSVSTARKGTITENESY